MRLPVSAEKPVLYTVQIVQYDADGNEEMAFSTKHGVREIVIKNSLVYINGERVFFKGVNRHTNGTPVQRVCFRLSAGSL